MEAVIVKHRKAVRAVGNLGGTNEKRKGKKEKSEDYSKTA
jgi:hypothetical protein